jgi:ribosome-associated protein
MNSDSGSLPRPPWPTDPDILEKEVEWSFFRSGGPGGQHRNKVETGVRLHHPPSGITITATEQRSQLRNRGLAMQRLIKALARLNRKPRKRVASKPTRGSIKRRLESKQRRSKLKSQRRPVDD